MSNDQRDRAGRYRASFRKRHSKALTVFGAVLIIAIFLAKEVFRESFVELHDSIEKAQGVISQADASDVLSSEQLITRLQARRLAQLSASAAANVAISRFDYQAEYTDIDQAFGHACDRFDRVHGMFLMLPSRAAVPLAKTDKYLAQSRIDMTKQVYTTVTKARSNLSPSPQDHAIVLIQLVAVEVFDLQVVSWEQQVVASATAIKDSAGRLIRFCTYTWWVLAMIGILLSAIGGFGEIQKRLADSAGV